MSRSHSAKNAKAAKIRTGKNASAKRTSRLTVRLDEESKQCLAEAAGLRRISLGDYVRAIAIPQARREIDAGARG